MGNATYVEGNPLGTPVHPHVHGERINNTRRRREPFGSSPRTWGTHSRAFRFRFGGRFIPTYMGNAPPKVSNIRPITVHPHVHGERPLEALAVAEGIGSSPRTWGTLEVPLLRQNGRRFIPTYMGNASRSCWSVGEKSVHPHVHGERSFTHTRRLADYGSSPRTWGTPDLHAGPHARNRFIPTYMGNASRCAPGLTAGTVHPHVHGERSRHRTRRAGGVGSSPRTWGTLKNHKLHYARPRFIPTYMGNASTENDWTAAGSVHPHVHGERFSFGILRKLGFGSSPRTWGTPHYSLSRCRSFRFIPTYMGNAGFVPQVPPQGTVHPHVHGERHIC
jgi:hypothetical protein